MTEPSVKEQLSGYRQSIDNIDAALVHLLAERFKATQRVGELKAELGLPPADPGREERQITRLRALADEAGRRQRVMLEHQDAQRHLARLPSLIRHHPQRISGPAMSTNPTIADAARELEDEFALFDDWRDKVEYIIYCMLTKTIIIIMQQQKQHQKRQHQQQQKQ